MLLPFHQYGLLEAGCDEAGRGCLAGPVYAAAVIFPPDIDKIEELSTLNDSKRLSAAQRYALRPIIEHYALSWAIGYVTAEEIDRVNILRASLIAMHKALHRLSLIPKHIIADGNRWLPYRKNENEVFEIPCQTIIKGDGKYMSIAAASILAKTYRDDYMEKIDSDFPMYGWKANKGYPTEKHYEAIEQYGLSLYHRRSFRYKKQVNDNRGER